MSVVVGMRERALRTARELRLGQTASGSEELVSLVDALAGILDPNTAPIFLPVLEPMLSAQARGDYLYLADLLEYELAPRFDPSAA